MHAYSDTLTDGMIRSEHTQLNGVPVPKSVLVTGGAGFIGGWFVRHLLQTYGDRYAVTCFDNLDYCASVNKFKAVSQLSNFHFVRGNVCTPKDVENALRNYHIDSIVHFAARSHVDTSLNDSLSFTQTNVIGTQVLLEVAREQGSIRRFIHVSTDEVYGENDAQNPTAFTEEQSLHPTNPYSASKAATEMIIQAYRKSFHIPLIIRKSFDACIPMGHYESDNWIEFVADRPVNDDMYWTDDSKLRALGWTQRTNFDEALRATVDWYCRDSEGFWPNYEGLGSTFFDGDVIAEDDYI
ncbi:NAD-dependent epimerase/dehydratase [Aspergillus oryzae]|uniref:NAD-dependent epimerase/dehydratase n=1 Tax=Aspergillus oryzae TaxID=5062 RepID=A0A1S9DDK0_ASPOZ|nr:NAD-dependent epimerase/dehydratase [Aspergillus oryzae]